MRSSPTRNLRQTAKKALLTLVVLLQAFTSYANDLSSLVEQRLGYMKDVAAYKWQHKLPIENSGRETFVLNEAVNQGLRFGITQESSRRFFTVQIAAAKEIQGYWFEQWQSQPSGQPQPGMNLEHEIRPALIRLGEDISAALAKGNPDLTRLQVKGLSKELRAELEAAARSVDTYPDRLAQVLDSGVLRVGTTGDYAPFSYRPDSSDNSAQWTGIDIDLARNLADSLGVTITWVHTSWPSLMDDLHSGRYDIGMSGISINLQRQQTAFFSKPYQSGGKTPLIRCSDADKYRSLTDIDQKSTRVIVNPGGTNQKFADTMLHRASVQLHDDNRTIFDEIINNNADVMFTDQIEVQLQSHKHPELCAAMDKQTLTFSQKGFLLPRDMVWKEYVDTWLNIRQGDGTLEELFNKHL